MDYKYKYLTDTGDGGNKEDEEVCSEDAIRLRIPSRYVTLTIVLLPLGAFFFSIFWAFHSNFRAATLVYCPENGSQVQNYLPSLSATIGDFSFSKKVWIICITLHAPPRFYYAYKYYKFLQSIIFKRYLCWMQAACSLHVIENLGLLGLSYISSKTSLRFHALNFTIFIISSILYMVIVCTLLTRCRNIQCGTKLEFQSQRYKIRFLFVILSCSVILPYVYLRHNTFCEEGIYTIFAFLEYIVVLCNMGFHFTAFWDFYDVIFRIKIPVGKLWSGS